MTIYAQTYEQALHDILHTVFSPDEYFMAYPWSSTTTTVEFGSHKDVWPDSHWVGGSGRMFYNGVVHTRRIKSFNSATGVLTFVHSFPVPPPTNVLFPIIRAGATFGQLEGAIRAAYHRIGTQYLIPVVSEAIALDCVGDDYPLPEDWRTVERVEIDWSRFARSDIAFGASGGEQSERGLASVVAQTHLAQPIVVGGQPAFTKRVWLKLRRIGTPTGTVTLRIEETTSGNPNGSLVTYAQATRQATEISTETSWHAFDFSDQVALWQNTTYALRLQASYSVSSTDYIAWALSPQASFSGGKSKTWNGSSWSDASGSHLFVVQTSPEWRVLENSRWSIVSGAAPSIVIRPVGMRLDGTPVRLHGQRIPKIPVADSDSIDVHPALLRDVAVAETQIRIARTNEELQRAMVFEQRANATMSQFRTLVRPTAKIVRV